MNEIDLGQVILALFRRKFLVTLTAFCFGAAGLAASFAIDAEYRATVVVAPVSDSPPLMLGRLAAELGPVASLAGLDSSDVSDGADVIEYFSSRAFAMHFLDDSERVALLFPDRWDSRARAWKSGKEPSANEIFARFDSHARSVFQNRKSGSYSISVTLQDRVATSAWANSLVAQLNEQLRSRSVRDARRSLAFLEAELARTQPVETRQAIARLMETQFQRIMLANTREEYAVRVVDPAVPPDEGDMVWPSRVLFAGISAALGALAASVVTVRKLLHVQKSSGE